MKRLFFTAICLAIEVVSAPAQGTKTRVMVESPQGVYISSYQDDWQETDNGGIYGGIEADSYTINWQDGHGGNGSLVTWGGLINETYSWPATTWPLPLTNGTVTYVLNGSTGVCYPPTLAMEQCNISEHYTDVSQGFWENLSETAHAEVKLATGGMTGSTGMNLWVISASATKYLPPWLSYPLASANIPSQNISILGKTLGSDGNLYLLLPDNTNMDITPVIAGAPDYYTFNVTTQKYKH